MPAVSAPMRGTLHITAREAAVGCRKEFTLPNMIHPIPFDIRPGLRVGRTVTAENVPFRAGGEVVYRRVDVTIVIDSDPAKSRNVIVFVAAALLILAAAVAYFRDRDTVVSPQGDEVITSTTASATTSTATSTATKTTTDYVGAYNAAVKTIPDFPRRVFLPKLEDRLLMNATAIYAAAADCAESVTFPTEMTVDELETVFGLVRADCPELLHLGSYAYTYRGDTAVAMTFRYTLTEEEYIEQRDFCVDAIDAMLSETEGMEIMEKVRYVVKSIAKRTVYDKFSDYCASPYGVFRAGRAKCDGISKAFQWAMLRMDIPCGYIAGADIADPDSPGHGWNVIRLGDRFLTVDVTGEVSVRESTGRVCLGYLSMPSQWLTANYRPYEMYDAVGGVPVTMNWLYHDLDGGKLVRTEEIGEWVDAAMPVLADGGVFLQFENDAVMAAFSDNSEAFFDALRQELGAAARGVTFHTVTFAKGHLIYIESFQA